MQQGGVSYSGTVPDKGKKVTHRRIPLSRTVPNIPLLFRPFYFRFSCSSTEVSSRSTGTVFPDVDGEFS